MQRPSSTSLFGAALLLTATLGLVGGVVPGPVASNGADFTPEQFGADPAGGFDATRGIQAALDAAAAIGGTVRMCGRYLQASGDIRQPQAVAAVGCGANFPGASWSGRDYSTTRSTIIQNPAHTWRLGSDTRLARLTFQRQGLAAPASFATTVAAATVNLQGTAVTLNGSDVALDDLLILGYAVGIASDHQSRFNIHRVNIDADTCFKINAMYDISTIDTIECYPFTTYNVKWGGANWPITGETVDAGGQIVLTVGGSSVTDAELQTGMPVNVIGPDGQPGVTNHYRIEVRGNQVTLAGSRLHPATTGTFAQGVTQIAVQDAASIGVGQAVAGSGIAPDSVVAAVNARARLVTVSRPTTLAATGAPLAFTSPAYRAGGSVRFEEIRRTGDGIGITNAQGLRVLSPFVLGHDIAYHAGSHAEGTLFVNAQTDYDAAAHDPHSASYVEDGDGAFSIFAGGFLNAQAYAAVLDRTPGSFQAPSVFNGTMLSGAGGYIIWANSGRASFTGSPQSAAGGQIYVGANMNSLVLAGNDWQGFPSIQYERPASAARVVAGGTELTGMLQFDGGTGAGPRIHARGASGLNGYLSLPGPKASWYFGTDADGYSLAVVDPGAPAVNTPTVSAGTLAAGTLAAGTGARPSPALFGATNGPAQFSGAGSSPTLLGSERSLATFQGGVGLTPQSSPIYRVPPSGGSVALGAGTMMTLIAGASPVAALTVQFPPAAADRQLVCFTTQVAINALVLASSAGAAFDDHIAAASPHATVCERFYASAGASGTWVHEKPQ